MIFKILSYLMCGYFLMAMVMQYNDPDTLIWIGLYAAILLATLLHLFKPALDIRRGLVLLVLFYGGGIFLLSDSFKDTSIEAFMAVGMRDLTDEKVRELWGLIICLVWTVVLLIQTGFVQEKSDLN